MPELSLSISKIGPEAAVILTDVFQLYLREMAQWFKVDTNADGSYAYNVSSVWDKGYDVYFAYIDNAIAGFALIGSASEWLGETGAHDVDEFFVLPSFRRRGVGQSMAAVLWDDRPGQWLVRVLEANSSALAFWRAAVSTYSPATFTEERRTVNGRPWRFFRFVAHVL